MSPPTNGGDVDVQLWVCRSRDGECMNIGQNAMQEDSNHTLAMLPRNTANSTVL